MCFFWLELVELFGCIDSTPNWLFVVVVLFLAIVSLNILSAFVLDYHIMYIDVLEGTSLVF